MEGSESCEAELIKQFNVVEVSALTASALASEGRRGGVELDPSALAPPC